MILVIPTSVNPKLPHYEQVTALDGRTYRFRFDFNSRAGRWSLTVLSDSGAVLAAGVALVEGSPLLRYHSPRPLPPGRLFVLDGRGLGAVPGLSDLGARCPFVYADASEVA